MSSLDDLSDAQIQQILCVGGIATGALAALAPGLFHRLYGTGEVDDIGLSMTRYFGNALAAGSVLVGLADDEHRKTALGVAAAFNCTSALLSFAAGDVPVGTRIRAGLTSAAFAGLAAYGATR